MLRYDTYGNFSEPNSWSAYDAGNTDGLVAKGYNGALYDNSRFVYFIPVYNGTTYHGVFLQFDISTDFNSSSSWSAYDASQTSGLDTRGYNLGVYKDGYMYFAPYLLEWEMCHGTVLRFNANMIFSNSLSWTAYDASLTSGLNSVGFAGAVADNQFIYFIPNCNPSFDPIFLRYDTNSEFSKPTSWEAYNASQTNGLDTRSYVGGVFDGRYVYFASDLSNLGNFLSTFLRFDTMGNFTNPSSWTAFISPYPFNGYAAPCFDSRYVYFPPYTSPVIGVASIALKYDTTGPFNDSVSWEQWNMNDTRSNLIVEEFYGCTVANGNVYFVPNTNGNVVQYTFFAGRRINTQIQVGKEIVAKNSPQFPFQLVCVC